MTIFNLVPDGEIILLITKKICFLKRNKEDTCIIASQDNEIAQELSHFFRIPITSSPLKSYGTIFCFSLNKINECLNHLANNGEIIFYTNSFTPNLLSQHGIITDI